MIATARTYTSIPHVHGLPGSSVVCGFPMGESESWDMGRMLTSDDAARGHCLVMGGEHSFNLKVYGVSRSRDAVGTMVVSGKLCPKRARYVGSVSRCRLIEADTAAVS